MEIGTDKLNRERKVQQQHDAIPSRPTKTITQSYDTLITICRELAYPQIWTFQGKFSRYFTPPPLGRILLLCAYWMVILVMIWSNTILTRSSPNYAYKWEIVGFRAAWVSVTQFPLIYILSGKGNIITLLTGISYERLNWLHRWVARTIFLTVIVHWSFFFTEWDIADFVKLELEWMPMVKYGFGAWATIGWMVLTGFGFFRSLCYELWLLQHLAAATVLLWLVYSHVPSYAQYNVWFAVGIVVFDRLVRGLKVVVGNFHLLRTKRRRQNRRLVGYEAEVKCLSPEFVRVIVRNVNFSWKPGQHVYLTIPWVGIIEAHPFTIANLSKSAAQQDGPNDLELYMKVHKGFTHRLHRRCREVEDRTFLSFVSGPWGCPPSLDRFESLILMATGNGSSFTVPIFQQAATTENQLRQISFIWIIRHPSQLDWFRSQMVAAWNVAQRRNVRISIQIFITRTVDDNRSLSSSEKSGTLPDQNGETNITLNNGLGDNKTEEQSQGEESDAVLDSSTEKGKGGHADVVSIPGSSSESQEKSDPININYCRPDLDPLVRPVVEEAWGETGILACGGAEFTGTIRNYIARLSDERAVHKGTGAQGLYLFCETYGW